MKSTCIFFQFKHNPPLICFQFSAIQLTTSNNCELSLCLENSRLNTCAFTCILHTLGCNYLHICKAEYSPNVCFLALLFYIAVYRCSNRNTRLYIRDSLRATPFIINRGPVYKPFFPLIKYKILLTRLNFGAKSVVFTFLVKVF